MDQSTTGLTAEATAPASAAAQTTVFEVWSKIAGMISGLAVILSVAYNWSYFETIDPAAIQYLSLGDHVSSALEWLPEAIFANLFAWGWQFVLNQLFPIPAVTASATPLHAMPRWKKVLIVVLVTCAIVANGLLSPSHNRLLFYGILMVLLIVYLMFFAGRAGLKSPWIIFMAIVPIIILRALGDGNSRGLTDLQSPQGTTTIVLKDEQSPLDKSLVMRRLEKGILIRRPSERKVLFIPWENVARVSEESPDYDTRSEICVRFGVLCGI